MRPVLRLMLLPIQAPMLLLLMAVSTYLGLHWSQPLESAEEHLRTLTPLIWSAECLQALVVVCVCTMPMWLLRQISTLMSASRVVTLVVTLLLVTIGGLYLLHMEVLANVMILGSSVMLARLDLVRVGVVPAPPLMATVLSVVVLAGINLGRMLGA